MATAGVFQYFFWVLLQPFRGYPTYKDVAIESYNGTCLGKIDKSQTDSTNHQQTRQITETSHKIKKSLSSTVGHSPALSGSGVRHCRALVSGTVGHWCRAEVSGTVGRAVCVCGEGCMRVCVCANYLRP